MAITTASTKLEELLQRLEQIGLLEELTQKIISEFKPRPRINLARQRFLNNERRPLYLYDSDIKELRKVELDSDEFKS